jgi:hypothetical protein
MATDRIFESEAPVERVRVAPAAGGGGGNAVAILSGFILLAVVIVAGFFAWTYAQDSRLRSHPVNTAAASLAHSTG